MGTEYLFIVDSCNIPLDLKIARADAHRDMSYWHRTTAIIIVDHDQRVLCQQRSFEKDENPGLWSYSFGGHVVYGEEVLHCAQKELEEEVGLCVPQADLHFQFIIPVERQKHFSYRYLCPYRPEYGVPEMADGEVIQLEWIPLSVLADDKYTKGKFTSPLRAQEKEALQVFFDTIRS